jgi:hypothetical protein
MNNHHIRVIAIVLIAMLVLGTAATLLGEVL